MSWELDLFGRIRRDSEAAFARYLSTEEGRRAVLITLVSDVATAYFLLRELDLQREVALRTLALNDQTVDYYRTRLAGGVSNRLELDSAVANRSLTAASVPDIERQMAILENAISVLAGARPARSFAARTLEEQTPPPRYSGRCSGHAPRAAPRRRRGRAAARRGECRHRRRQGAVLPDDQPDRFPRDGQRRSVQSAQRRLGDLVARRRPLSAALQRRPHPAELRGGTCPFRRAIAEYQQTAINAYREVSDALIAIEKLALVRTEQQAGVVALRDASQLSRDRYDIGLSSVPRDSGRRPAALSSASSTWRARAVTRCARSRSCIARSAAAGSRSRPPLRRRPPPTTP